jgi:hypothetical protein
MFGGVLGLVVYWNFGAGFGSILMYVVVYHGEWMVMIVFGVSCVWGWSCVSHLWPGMLFVIGFDHFAAES